MFIEAILTAFTVSIDGFFSGLAIGIKKTKINIKKLIIISSIPIIMAIPIMLFGRYIKNFINNNIANYIGFCLFIILAISSFLQIINNKESILEEKKVINLYNSIIIGFTIGIDSSISAFSLALNNHNPFVTPFYFGIFHGILIYLGNVIALKKCISNIRITEYLSPILFIVLAITKII